jgi:hypothetical protein
MDSSVVYNIYTAETVVKIILVKFAVLLVWPHEEAMLHALLDITNSMEQNPSKESGNHSRNSEPSITILNYYRLELK